VALFSEINLKPHERFYISNHHLHRTDGFPGRKVVTALAVRKGIPHSHVYLPPPVSIEATGICIPLGNTELLLAAWNDADTIELLNFRRKSVLAGDLNGKHPAQFQTPQVRNSWNCLTLKSLKFQPHSVPLTILLQGLVTC
jgi:hypothetical protein